MVLLALPFAPRLFFLASLSQPEGNAVVGSDGKRVREKGRGAGTAAYQGIENGAVGTRDIVTSSKS